MSTSPKSPNRDQDHSVSQPGTESPAGDRYTVVARRYRPKTFEELVGQDTVSVALLRAIETHRVGHAYLFTGARGVGKTSTARIFAKALNASTDGTGRFDPHSEIAQAIDTGEDMDVIEIDGASNRGIDEIRQLRSNASIRPTRSKYKIYIIDEVHMLTTPAFNALLKTLEEPPAHVKFVFCTTDPEKIPITVLSRCQRFDFPPVQTDQILGRLKLICETEGTDADDAALRLIARRAAGSMRDSQSLLEQLLSFGGNRITVEDVHGMLGTADEARLANFAKCLIDRNASGSLIELDDAVNAGVDPGQLAEQLLGYLRDMMAVSIGGPAELMRTANPNSMESLRASGHAWGTMTLLSAMQLLDETIVRMKHSLQSRILLEVALVQICNLVDLQALADVVKGISQGLTPSGSPQQRVTPSSTMRSVTPSPPPKAANSAVSPAPRNFPSSTPSAPASVDEGKKKDELNGIQSNSSAVGSSSIVSEANRPNSADSKSAETESTEAKSIQHDTHLHDSDKQKIASANPDVAKAPASVSSSVMDSSESNPATEDAVVSLSALTSDRDIHQGNEATPESTSKTVVADQPIQFLRDASASLDGLIQQAGEMALDVIALAPNRWQVLLAREASYALPNFQSSHNLNRLVRALHAVTGSEIGLEFVLTDRPLPTDPLRSGSSEAAEGSPKPAIHQTQRIRDAMAVPLVRKFLEIFDGQILRIDDRPAVLPPVEVAPSAADDDRGVGME
ncbi:MAG: DNA polymerase III subunit gamma/tau [Planctomycetota bacterium]